MLTRVNLLRRKVQKPHRSATGKHRRTASHRESAALKSEREPKTRPKRSSHPSLPRNLQLRPCSPIVTRIITLYCTVLWESLYRQLRSRSSTRNRLLRHSTMVRARLETCPPRPRRAFFSPTKCPQSKPPPPLQARAVLTPLILFPRPTRWQGVQELETRNPKRIATLKSKLASKMKCSCMKRRRLFRLPLSKW